VTLSAVGTVDMQSCDFFQRDFRVQERMQLDVRAPANGSSTLQGQFALQNVLHDASRSRGPANLNGVLDVSKRQVTITQLAGESEATDFRRGGLRIGHSFK